MRLGGNNSGLRELLGSLALISLIAAAPIALAPPANAQSGDFANATADADSDGAPVTSDDTAPASSMDRPAPSADYDVPADTSADPASPAAAELSASSDTTASASDDQVLEIPQVINPSTYAARAAAAIADGTGPDDDSADQLAADSSASANAAQNSSGQAAQADPGDGAGNAQDYADQDDDGGGPVVVYAGPVYIPEYVPPPPVNVTPPPQSYVINNGRLPAYSALAYRALPMYSGLATAPGRYATPGGGSRLWGSHLGQSFAMHGSMGGFGHAR